MENTKNDEDYNVPDRLDREEKLHLLIKSLLSLIPSAGSVAAELFNLVVSSPYEKRKINWMKKVATGLKKLEDRHEGIVKELSANEEFISLLIQTSQMAMKFHQEEKIEYLLNCLINSLSLDYEFEIKSSLINTLESLSPFQIVLLDQTESLQGDQQLVKYTSFKDLYRLYSARENRFVDMGIGDFKFFLNDLRGKNLIYLSDYLDDEEHVYSSNLLSIGGEDENKPRIKISEYGIRLLSLVRPVEQ